MKALHLILTVAWIVIMPLALLTGWIYSVAFVAAISIYANAAGHWSAYQAARAEDEAT